MRRRARIDQNQPEIVKALRDFGATVQHLHAVGKGCPDLLVGYKGINWLFEVKNPTKKPSQRVLTDDEKAWHCAWLGEVFVVEHAQQAVERIQSQLKVTPSFYADH